MKKHRARELRERPSSVCEPIVVGLPGTADPMLWGQEGYPAQGRFLDELAVLKNTKTARISSYDRSGGNFDWITVLPGETKTLAEIPGAGSVRRTYFLTWSAADRMRFRKFILRM